MSESIIGIKIANGEFFPILYEGKPGKKRLILTTVNDNQESVQIDLYKGPDESIEDASYIGSLFIEEIEPSESGEPEIELIVGVDPEGNLEAEASYKKLGEKQNLTVSLNAVSDMYDAPDFAINDEGEDIFDDAPAMASPDVSGEEAEDDFSFSDDSPFSLDEGENDENAAAAEDDFDFGFSEDESSSESSKDSDLDFGESQDFDDSFSADEDFASDFDESFSDGSFDDSDSDSFTEVIDTTQLNLKKEEKDRPVPKSTGRKENVKKEEKKEMEEEQKEEKKKGLLGIILLLLVLALGIFLLVYFLVLRPQGEEASPTESAPAPMVSETPTPPPAVKEPEAAAKPETPPAPVVVKPAEEKKEGFWYLIKKGDTLWDLSNAFYRTPWQYGKIAKANNIANPDLIYWGFRIYIPEN